jgi:hypothetical protein
MLSSAIPILNPYNLDALEISISWPLEIYSHFKAFKEANKWSYHLFPLALFHLSLSPFSSIFLLTHFSSISSPLLQLKVYK